METTSPEAIVRSSAAMMVVPAWLLASRLMTTGHPLRDLALLETDNACRKPVVGHLVSADHRVQRPDADPGHARERLIGDRDAPKRVIAMAGMRKDVATAHHPVRGERVT